MSLRCDPRQTRRAPPFSFIQRTLSEGFTQLHIFLHTCTCNPFRINRLLHGSLYTKHFLAVPFWDVTAFSPGIAATGVQPEMAVATGVAASAGRSDHRGRGKELRQRGGARRLVMRAMGRPTQKMWMTTPMSIILTENGRLVALESGRTMCCMKK